MFHLHLVCFIYHLNCYPALHFGKSLSLTRLFSLEVINTLIIGIYWECLVHIMTYLPFVWTTKMIQWRCQVHLTRRCFMYFTYWTCCFPLYSWLCFPDNALVSHSFNKVFFCIYKKFQFQGKLVKVGSFLCCLVFLKNC